MTDTRRKDRTRLRDQELLEVFAHTDTRMHKPTHTQIHTHTHTAPPLLCIFIYEYPAIWYLIPTFLSHLPVPACAALLPEMILHDPFTLFH